MVSFRNERQEMKRLLGHSNEFYEDNINCNNLSESETRETVVDQIDTINGSDPCSNDVRLLLAESKLAQRLLNEILHKIVSELDKVVGMVKNTIRDTISSPIYSKIVPTDNLALRSMHFSSGRG